MDSVRINGILGIATLEDYPLAPTGAEQGPHVVMTGRSRLHRGTDARVAQHANRLVEQRR